MLLKYGCISCHQDPDIENKIGPSFAELRFNKIPIKNNDEIENSKNYIRTSVVSPNEKIRMGYRKYSMPGFDNKIDSTDLEKIVNLLYAEEFR